MGFVTEWHPYSDLIEAIRKHTRHESEYELIDTEIFDPGRHELRS